ALFAHAMLIAKGCAFTIVEVAGGTPTLHYASGRRPCAMGAGTSSGERAKSPGSSATIASIACSTERGRAPATSVVQGPTTSQSRMASSSSENVGSAVTTVSRTNASIEADWTFAVEP